MKKVFNATGDFAATYEAEQWLKDNGYSVGTMQRGDPRGIMKGDFVIMKWRNLSAKDRAALHGQMTGDGRNGPITVEIFGEADK